jgi:lycopene beta-cyclase
MCSKRLILVGAGLAATLIAQRLSARADPPEILMLEARSTPHGDHTWSFHLSDLDASDLEWMEPLVGHRWPGQWVRFPAYARYLPMPYASLTGASVARQLARLSNVTLEAGARAHLVRPHGVELADGRRIEASCVVDARGFEPHPALALGWQKFVGVEVETERPHGVDEPVIMDASIDQADGYRFVYLLPFSATRLLIEDTVYADGKALDAEELDARIAAYAAERGWTIRRVCRREKGVLPIALAFDARRFWAERPVDVPQVGLRAALFHPTTGYSLPEGVRVANLIDGVWPIGSAPLARVLRVHALERARAQRFHRFLSRMLFRAASAERRYLVLQHFYRLPLPLIQRFYAGRTTFADSVRILSGRPPVPLGRALACLAESRLLKDRGVAKEAHR